MFELILFALINATSLGFFFVKYFVPFTAQMGLEPSPEQVFDFAIGLVLLSLPAYSALSYFIFGNIVLLSSIFVLSGCIAAHLFRPNFCTLVENIKQTRNEYLTANAGVAQPEPEREPDPPKVTIPDHLRTEHMMILAGSGQGKTQAMQEMLVKDIQSGDTVIVIDSQEGMLERLLHIVPVERLMYLDPTNKDFPLALSAFSVASKDEKDVSNSISLYEFMFASLGTGLTAKQSTLYRYLSRMLLLIPNSNFNTALEILRKGAPLAYMSQLPPTAQQFFTEQFMGQGFKSTREEVSQRLYTLLDNPAIGRMFNAPEAKVDIGQAIKDKKVILINTAQGTLGHQGASLFGRYCLAKIAMEVLARPETKERVYLYMDEAQEYLSGDDIIKRLFEQGRKRGLCMVCAFHSLTQIEDKSLVALIRTNTAIKLAGGVNSSDATALYKDMQMYDAQPLTVKNKLQFWLSAGSEGTQRYDVTPLVLENATQRDKATIKEIKDYNAYRYGYEPEVKAPATYNDPDAPQDLD